MFLNKVPPKIRDNKNRIKKITNKILAIPAALAAMPVNPNTAATRAIIKKMIE